jgi:ribosome-associated toxin RatA of RatAB toxin-antitoxin module
MASTVSRDVLVAVPPERFFELLLDFDRYPEFVPGVKACRPKPPGPGGTIDVEYEVDLGVKTIRYVLRHEVERPRRIRWSLLSGEWMKVSNGSWDLADEGGATRARYAVEIQIAKPALVPQALVDRVTDELTKVQLPKMLDAFKARAEGRRA